MLLKLVTLEKPNPEPDTVMLEKYFGNRLVGPAILSHDRSEVIACDAVLDRCSIVKITRAAFLIPDPVRHLVEV